MLVKIDASCLKILKRVSKNKIPIQYQVSKNVAKKANTLRAYPIIPKQKISRSNAIFSHNIELKKLSFDIQLETARSVNEVN